MAYLTADTELKLMKVPMVLLPPLTHYNKTNNSTSCHNWAECSHSIYMTNPVCVPSWILITFPYLGKLIRSNPLRNNGLAYIDEVRDSISHSSATQVTLKWPHCHLPCTKTYQNTKNSILDVKIQKLNASAYHHIVSMHLIIHAHSQR